jgi:SAM-dependent methyltransferase
VTAHEPNPASNPHFGLAPSPWIVRFAHLVPHGARVLDVAAGHGRHALLFASRGAHVTAVDRDVAALATLEGRSGIETRALDLETGAWPLAGESFDAIVVVHYLHRPTLAQLVGALAPDGALLYETFAQGNASYGRPANPDFLLRREELLDVVRGRLAVVAFEQGTTDNHGRPAVLQRIAAVGPKRPWPPALSP